MEITKNDYELISGIAKRIKKLFDETAGQRRDTLSWVMDIEAAHQDVGLRLEELLGADQPDFVHDLVGIANHLNRETKKLEDGFLPRFAIN